MKSYFDYTSMYEMDLYYDHLPKLWKTCLDCYLGTPAIKNINNADRYLPKTKRERDSEMHSKASHLYPFRLAHTTYENFFQSVINDSVGIMQKNPPRISFGVESEHDIAPEVRDINIYGNKCNDGLKGLKWRLNFNQALFGRYGLLMDVVTEPDGTSPRFVITEYPANQILEGEDGEPLANGHASLKWIRLNETRRKYDSKIKMWRPYLKYRILGLDANGDYYSVTLEGQDALDDWAAFDFLNPGASKHETLVYPSFKGNRLNFIPFTVCNATKIGFDNWQFPPYYDVATLGIGVYQMDSVYKTALWNSASPTLGVLNAKLDAGENGEVYLGNIIELQSGGEYPADAKMLETSAAGLQEMRMSKEEMKKTLKYFALRDLLDGAGANSSGDAIELRTISGTSSVAAIDTAGALAIEEQIIYADIWAGDSPKDAADKISFEADTSYLNSELLLQSVITLIQSNTSSVDGNPVLSKENIYKILEKTIPNTLSSYSDNERQVLNNLAHAKEKAAQNDEMNDDNNMIENADEDSPENEQEKKV